MLRTLHFHSVMHKLDDDNNVFSPLVFPCKHKFFSLHFWVKWCKALLCKQGLSSTQESLQLWIVPTQENIHILLVS